MIVILQAEAVESVESELETAKDRLRKNVEAVDGINKSILVFESRHVETVERMKEVGRFIDGRSERDSPPVVEKVQQYDMIRFLKQFCNCTGDRACFVCGDVREEPRAVSRAGHCSSHGRLLQPGKTPQKCDQ